MKKQLTALVVLAACAVVYAAPVQTTVAITQAADKEFVEDYEAAADRLGTLAADAKKLEDKSAGLAARAAIKRAEALALGIRVRRRLVAHKPTLDGILPASISDIAVVRSGSDVTHIKFNADAEAHRAGS